jgi:hypothetical protein
MRTAFWICFLLAAVAVAVTMVSRPRSVFIPEKPEIAEISQMQTMSREFAQTVRERPDLAGVDLRAKSLDELAELGVLPPGAPAYLREHEVKYLGYSESVDGKRVPLFMKTYWYPEERVWQRWTFFTDGTAKTKDVKAGE